MSSAILKKLGIVAILLVLLLLVYFYRQVPHSQSPFSHSQDDTTLVTLTQHARGVQLKKNGATWTVQAISSAGSTVQATSVAWPADNDMVKTLLSGLQTVQLEDVISDRADRQGDFEVDEMHGLHVAAMGKSGTLSSGVFGKQAPDFTHLYFKFADRPQIYLARGIIRGELGGADSLKWRSHQLIDLPETAIQEITMEGPGVKTDLVRKSTDTWMMGDKAVESGPVDALVGTLAHLRAADFVDPVLYPALNYETLNYGRVIVKGINATVELKIGPKESKTGQYPVSTSREAGVSWLPESVIRSLQQKYSAFKSLK